MAMGQKSEVHELCKNALFQLKDSVDYLIQTDPYFKDKLELGVVDLDSLSVSFAFKSEKPPAKPKRIPKRLRKSIVRPYQYVFQGVQFRFKHPIQRPVRNFAKTFEWHLLDVQLFWHWSWPMIRFDSKDQKKVMLALKDAVEPISRFEQKTYEKLKISAEEKGVILEGKQSIELFLEPNPDTLSGKMDLYAYNTGNKTVYLTNEFLHTWIVDDSLYNHHIPHSFIAYFQDQHNDPFIQVPKKEKVFLASIPLPMIKERAESVRLICSFNTNGWMDFRPTLWRWSACLPNS